MNNLFSSSSARLAAVIGAGALVLPHTTKAQEGPLTSSTPDIGLSLSSPGPSVKTVVRGSDGAEFGVSKTNLGSPAVIFSDPSLKGSYPETATVFLVATRQPGSTETFNADKYDVRIGLDYLRNAPRPEASRNVQASTHDTFSRALHADKNAVLSIESAGEVAGSKIFRVTGRFANTGSFNGYSEGTKNAVSVDVLEKYTSTSSPASAWSFSLAKNSAGLPAVELTYSNVPPQFLDGRETSVEAWPSSPGRMTLWWTGPVGQRDYTQFVNGIDASQSLTTWSYSGPIAPFQAKIKTTDGVRNYFRATYTPTEIIGEPNQPVKWTGNGAFPFKTEWTLAGSNQYGKEYEFVATQPTSNGINKTPVTTVTGKGVAPYMPTNETYYIYRAVVKNGQGEEILSVPLANGKGELGSTKVTIPTAKDQIGNTLTLQFRTNSSSAWVEDFAAFSGTGNGGLGFPTKGVFPAAPYKLGH